VWMSHSEETTIPADQGSTKWRVGKTVNNGAVVTIIPMTLEMNAVSWRMEVTPCP
jgi:hypothetical protein